MGSWAAGRCRAIATGTCSATASSVLIPLPGHTPGSMGAAVHLDRDGSFLSGVGRREPARKSGCRYRARNTWNADALLNSFGEIRRIEKSQAQPSSAGMMTPNGRACARGQRRMSKDRHRPDLRPAAAASCRMPIRRTEDPRLLTGNGEYASDRKPDRALHVAFRRSEQPHATIVRIEARQAEAAPGVVAVLDRR